MKTLFNNFFKCQLPGITITDIMFTHGFLEKGFSGLFYLQSVNVFSSLNDFNNSILYR